MANYKSDLTDYDLTWKGETYKGIWVQAHEEKEDFFLPNSQVQYEEKEYKRGDRITVSIPEWLADKHNLL